jgi:hypothetical protein
MTSIYNYYYKIIVYKPKCNVLAIELQIVILIDFSHSSAQVIHN